VFCDVIFMPLVSMAITNEINLGSAVDRGNE